MREREVNVSPGRRRAHPPGNYPCTQMCAGIPGERLSIHTDSLWPRKFNTNRERRRRYFANAFRPAQFIASCFELCLSAPRFACVSLSFFSWIVLMRKILKTRTDGCCAQLMAMKSASLVFTSRQMKMLLVFAAANLEEWNPVQELANHLSLPRWVRSVYVLYTHFIYLVAQKCSLRVIF